MRSQAYKDALMKDLTDGCARLETKKAEAVQALAGGAEEQISANLTVSWETHGINMFKFVSSENKLRM